MESSLNLPRSVRLPRVRLPFNPLHYGVVILAWEIGARVNPSPMFSRPSAALEAALSNTALLARDASSSLQFILTGIMLAWGVGLFLACLAYYARPFRVFFFPALNMIRGIPGLALFPLFLLLFGLGIGGKVAIILWTALPPVILGSYTALRTATPDVLEAARMDGAGALTELVRVRLPLALPGILTAFSVSISTGWISLVAAEMLGASKGLGFRTLIAAQSFEFPLMYAAILVIAFLGFSMVTILNLFARYMEARYA